jgi:hypothetical protein
MNEEKRRLIDDDVIIGLINNFKTKQWLDRVMEKGMRAGSKPIARINHLIEETIPVLDLANKTALPKTLQP